MRDLVEGAIAWAIVLGALAAAIAMLLAGVNHSDHVSCLRLHENTGLETRFARSGPNGECYVKVDDQWVPEDRWRQMEGS